MNLITVLYTKILIILILFQLLSSKFIKLPLNLFIYLFNSIRKLSPYYYFYYLFRCTPMTAVLNFQMRQSTVADKVQYPLVKKSV